MTIIISEDGKDAKRVSPSGFDKEDFLQNYIYNNPDAVPVYEIDEDIRLLILAREFGTASGPIDALGVDQNGNIYLIETKLYKNPDKRTVVAQVLDYGASLWSSSIDFADFTMQLEKYVQKQFHMSLTDKLQEFFGIGEAEVENIMTNIQTNLNSGIFKFVVLMDNLHRRLKDLIIFMNRNSQFDIYAVELEYYKHKTFEIIIPRMFGNEVKKEVVSTKTSASGRRKWDETSYWQEVESKLAPAKVAALRKLYEWASKNADQIRWGTGMARGSFNPQVKKISPISFVSVFSDGSVQISYGYLPEDMELRKRLRETLIKYVDVPGVTDATDGALKSTYRSIPPEYAEEHMGEIIEALTEFINA
jgi:hypothetical protein